MKWRNSKERELLAAGGSREQTLPNKNNPHPDLSDADSDKPKLDLTDISPVGSPIDHHSTIAARDDQLAYSSGNNGNYIPGYQENINDYDSSESEEEINVT